MSELPKGRSSYWLKHSWAPKRLTAYRALAYLLCLGGIGLLGGPARAQGIRWEISAGFDNVFKEGAWTPVFVDITNEGESQAGEIVIPVTYPGSKAVRTNYVAVVDLPRHSHKRYTLYLPSDGIEKVYLNLATGRAKKELAHQRSAAPEDTLVVVVGGDPSLLSFLNGTKTAAAVQQPYGPGMAYPVEAKQGQIHVGRADWTGLPESWLGWEGVDAVVLGDAGFAGASSQAIEALLRWVKLGGTLVVSGGALSPAMASGPIRELLPIEVSGTTTLSHLDPLAAWAEEPLDRQPVLAAAGVLRTDSTVLCGTHQRPLIAARQVGTGHVVMAVFDFGGAPIKYWDGQTSMWPRLLAGAAAPPSLTTRAEESQRGYYSGQSLADVAVYTPQARLPSILLIVGFLVVYIIVLAPVQYLVLRRLDRRELAWVTTPFIVALFTVGAYATGYGIRGGETIVNRLGIIEASSGSNLARGRGYVGLFSPGRTSYEFLLEETAAGARDLTPEHQLIRRPASVLHGPTPRIANVLMHMWTTRAFGVEFVADLGQGISGVLEYDGTKLQGTVKNETGLDLEKCRLISGGRLGPAKDLPAAEQAEFSFEKGAATALPDHSHYRARSPHEEPANLADLATSALFAERSYGPYSSSPSMAALRSRPYLVALCEEPLVPVQLAGRRPKTTDRNLIIVSLPIRLSSGQQIAVPSWLISERLVASEGRVTEGASYMGGGGLTVAEGEAVLEFRVPVGKAGGRATGLSLMLTASTGYGYPGGPPLGTAKSRVLAYDFAREKWEWIQNVQQHPSLPHPADFMSRDGRVLIKLEASSGQAEFGVVELAAEVQTF